MGVELMSQSKPTPAEIPGDASSLGHFPAGSWEFDEAVTRVFDDMLARSIPHLASMRSLVEHLGGALIQPDTDVVDLGCACGQGIEPFLDGRENSNRFLGIDCSQPMLSEARQRFRHHIQMGAVDFRDIDLRVEYPNVRASLTLCILTLQFIPIESRYRVLDAVRKHTVAGGGLLLVEKVLGGDPVMDALLVDQYHAHKRSMGYSPEEVESKRRSLQGVLVPLTSAWNEDLLRTVGFRHIECFWRCMNFCGWIALV
jgi:tRNA (cmo5U34)-methyltransferase